MSVRLSIGKSCSKILLAFTCFWSAETALAVVQFQAELADISSMRGSSFEFITIEGETVDVDVDPNGVIVLQDLSDLDLVRGGALEVRPTNGRPAFTATVPMSWDGTAALVLDFDSQSLTPDPDVTVRPYSDFSSGLERTADLVIENNPMYYINRRANEIREMAQDLGLPEYVLDANELEIRRWFLELWLRYTTMTLGMNPSRINIEASFLTFQLLQAVLSINAPTADVQEALQTDECRVVSAEAFRDIPVAVSLITAEDIRLSGAVSSLAPMTVQASRVQLVAQRNPFGSVDAYWGIEDGFPPVVAFTDERGQFQLQIPRSFFISGPQHTLRNQPEQFPPRMVSTLVFEPEPPGLDTAALDAVLDSYYRENPMQLMTANMCYQSRMIDLDFEYLFGSD